MSLLRRVFGTFTGTGAGAGFRLADGLAMEDSFQLRGWRVPQGWAMRSRNMRSRETGCKSEARKRGGTNLRRWRGVPARHTQANNERQCPAPVICDKMCSREE